MKKTLWIIALIAIVNALGYGIIIPILYSYSRKFGLTDFQNGLLFSIFSVFQFIATPLIGRLSDAYGRRPLLLISLLGTSASFFTMAFAQNAAWLFIARALDGVTAGNIPVALAVISDTTEAKNRARGFGIIGASFGFGFTFGPAISAFTLHLGESAPFIIAGVIALVAFLLTAVFLPETNMHKGSQVSRHVFDFRHLFHALVDPAIGKTLIVSFLVMLAFSIFIYAFQPMSVEVLRLSPQQISVIFTIMGVIGLISQGMVIPRVIRLFGERVTLVGAMAVSVVTYTVLYFMRAYPLFLTVVLIQSFANGFANPIIQALLSKEADVKSQGSILGVNASYQSIGQIVGPVIGGMLSTLFIPLPFLAAAMVMGAAMLLSYGMLKQHLRARSLV